MFSDGTTVNVQFSAVFPSFPTLHRPDNHSCYSRLWPPLYARRKSCGGCHRWAVLPETVPGWKFVVLWNLRNGTKCPEVRHQAAGVQRNRQLPVNLPNHFVLRGAWTPQSSHGAGVPSPRKQCRDVSEKKRDSRPPEIDRWVVPLSPPLRVHCWNPFPPRLAWFWPTLCGVSIYTPGRSAGTLGLGVTLTATTKDCPQEKPPAKNVKIMRQKEFPRRREKMGHISLQHIPFLSAELLG